MPTCTYTVPHALAPRLSHAHTHKDLWSLRPLSQAESNDHICGGAEKEKISSTVE